MTRSVFDPRRCTSDTPLQNEKPSLCLACSQPSIAFVPITFRCERLKTRKEKVTHTTPNDIAKRSSVVTSIDPSVSVKQDGLRNGPKTTDVASL